MYVIFPRITIPVYFLDERDAVQKKTFTKWVNCHLARVSCRISDLYNDLRDGYMLTRLLEVLSGELLVSLLAPLIIQSPVRFHSLTFHLLIRITV